MILNYKPYLQILINGLCIFLFIRIDASAQVAVSGMVVDKDGDAMVSAIVIGKKSDRGVYPNANGEFRLILYPPDTIIVSAMGYEIKRVPVSANDSSLKHKIKIVLTGK